MKILVTARYITGEAREGGSGRFYATAIRALRHEGHEVIASTDPSGIASESFDLIICSHHETFQAIKNNPARKIYISHGLINDEAPLPGADRYVYASEEARNFHLRSRGIDGEVIPQPVVIGEQKRPGNELKKILIIRRVEYTKTDPFAFLSEKYEVHYSDPAKPIEDQIAWADLCIVIGRGAIESMAQGKPVLIADNRGYIGALGDGYVNQENIREIALCNFSGRRFKNPLTREWIEGELAKYDAADSDFLYDYAKQNHDARKIVNQYLAEIETRQVHLVIPFWRKQNKGILMDAYRPMNVIMHPIMFEDEVIEFNESWVIPCIIPMSKSQDFGTMEVQNVKRNYFIKNEPIIDEDYYVAVDDDDMYEPRVFDEIKKMNDDIVIISMKRGTHTPKNATLDRKYPTNTLKAHPENVKVGDISNQQSFVKGKVFRKYPYDDQRWCADGRLAVRRKEAGEQTAYRPDLFALFNYYEPGRWEGPKISFGVLVNDWVRFGQVFKQSKIVGEAHFIKEPESATKGLNQLLDIIEAEGADIAVLSHQDMHYQADWLPKIREQIAKLPDNWVVAGIIGKDMSGKIAGVFRDMRIPNYFDTSDIHEFPVAASCFDECCIIVNMKSGFRFDEELEGFDLYGSLCCLQAVEMGGTAWIIDAYAEHYCLRPFTWHPDETYCRRFKWLWEKYNKVGRVDTTAIGFVEEQDIAS